MKAKLPATTVTPWSADAATGVRTRTVAAVFDRDEPPRRSSSSPNDRVAGERTTVENLLPARYDAMCRAIDACVQLDEIVEMRDQAAALGVYAKMARNVDAERRTAQIRLRAERRVGQLSAALTRRQGTRGLNNDGRTAAAQTKRAQLSAAGISVQQSKIWEKVAAIPQPTFEDALRKVDRLSTRAVLEAAWRPKRPNKCHSSVLSLWKRLCLIERDGLLEVEPATLLQSATPVMLHDIKLLGPRIAAWLTRVAAAIDDGVTGPALHRRDRRRRRSASR